MISDQEIEVDGTRYRWSCNDDVADPGNCWTWADADRNLTPPQGMLTRLNKRFFEDRAAGIVAMIDGPDVTRFLDILRAMGASEEVVTATGLRAKLAAPKAPMTGNPFSNSVLRDWFLDVLREKRPPWSVSDNWWLEVNVAGQGPFDSGEFASFLLGLGVKSWDIADEQGSLTCYLALGRAGWDKDDINSWIDANCNGPMYIYSQEMLLAFFATGFDPLEAPASVLEAFKEGHPGLEFVAEGWPGWVTVFASVDDRATSSQKESIDLAPETPLHRLGYRAGKTGEPTDVRRKILRQAFKGQLPFVNSAEYMLQWGDPDSPRRLKKIADLIAWSCRSKKHLGEGFEPAIEDWESDLEWLRQEFYHGRFRFRWPDTFVGS